MAVNNNLLAQSILSPALDLDNFRAVDNAVHGGIKTIVNNMQGTINKKILLNRVKKLTQDQRKELIDALEGLSKQLSPSLNLPPLRERGVCALILADDGKKAEGHFFITSFFLGLFNRFGKRIGSAKVMEKIRKTRQELFDSGYHPLTGNVDLCAHLTASMGNLKKEIDDASQLPQIQPLIDELAGIKNKFSEESGKDWAELATLVEFLCKLFTFRAKLSGTVSLQVADKITSEIEKIKKTINCRKQSTSLQDFASHALGTIFPELPHYKIEGKNILHYEFLAEFGIHPSRLQVWYDDLTRMVEGKGLDRKEIKYWESDFLTRLINFRLLYIENLLKGEASSFEGKKAKLGNEYAIIQERLNQYQENIFKAGQREGFSQTTSKISGINKELVNLTSICDLLALLSSIKDKSYGEIKTFLSLASGQFQKSPNVELRAVQNIEQNLFSLTTAVLTTNNHNALQHLASSLNLAILNGAADPNLIALYGRLYAFKSNPGNYPLNNDDLKKSFINDYIAYWKFVFDQLKVNAEATLKAEQDKANALQAALNSQSKRLVKPIAAQSQGNNNVLLLPPVPLQHSQPQNPQPPVVVSPHPQVNNLLPPSRNIPTAGNPGLIAIASALQSNGSSQISAIINQYQNNSSLPAYLMGQVYGNFYWIMKDAGQLCGEIDSAGHSLDPNWGGNVFLNGQNNSGVALRIDSASLNNYRLQAVNEVLRAQIRIGAHQMF